jgi:hypothetical protein
MRVSLVFRQLDKQLGEKSAALRALIIAATTDPNRVEFVEENYGPRKGARLFKHVSQVLLTFSLVPKTYAQQS